MIIYIILCVISVLACAGIVVVSVFNRRILKAEEQLKAENDELLVRNEKLEKINQAKNDYLLHMSHDVRTPLNAIKGFVTIAEKSIDKPEKLALYFKKIDVSCAHLLELFSSIIDLARIENGKIKHCMENFDLLELSDQLSTVLGGLPSERERKNIVEISLDGVSNSKVMGDKTHLTQVLLNILTNAVKYSEPYSPVTFTIVQKPGTKIGFSVFDFVIEDHGLGMDKDLLSKVYTPFVRGNYYFPDSLQGCGLGLAIAKRLVEFMDGSIEVQSELNKGTIVTVSVELKNVIEKNDYISDVKDYEALCGKYKAGKNGDSVFASKRILVVEDNYFNLEIATEILKAAGFIVEDACDGSVAVQMVENNPPDYYDFILMDIQMSIMDGYEATRAIRDIKKADYSKLPIIAMSANVFEEDMEKAEQAGMNGYVSKPVDQRLLFETLEKFL